MTIKEYLDIASFFPLIEVSQLNEKGEYLDRYMKAMYGNRSCGMLITTLLESDGTITEANQKFIASMVYGFYKNKWDMLIKYSEEEMNPLIQSRKETIESYGKIVGNKLSGSDNYSTVDKIAGFDSSDFVNNSNNIQTNEYGKETNKTYGGSDTKVIESRDSQSEKLLSYALNFWDSVGITRTIVHDALNKLALPVYNIEED